jgi:beta-xylosidase
MKKFIFCFFSLFLIMACATSPSGKGSRPRYLVPSDYMADPSAHVFNGKVYIYPSHDRDTSGYKGSKVNGGEFDMIDYHVFSLNDVFNGDVTDHGVILALDDISWANGQLWAPDVAHKNGKYYMYFPAKDRNDIFRIGVAIADRPEGPFVPQAEPINGSYSIDPCVFEDNGNYYMYFGGIWGGQLQCYENNIYKYPAKLNSDYGITGYIGPRVVKLSNNMLAFDGDPQEVKITYENGTSIPWGDTGKHFFEASWMHKYNGKYYFSYSTGDSHNICYAIGTSPFGPFIYQGVILTQVTGWTTHYSIVEYNEKWYLFYHDSNPSRGKDHLRSTKVTELTYLPNGTIKKINGMAK